MKYDMLRVKPLARNVTTKELKLYLSETVATHIGGLKVSGSPDKEIKAWESFEVYLTKYSADRKYYEMMMSTMKVEHSIFRHDFMMNPD